MDSKASTSMGEFAGLILLCLHARLLSQNGMSCQLSGRSDTELIAPISASCWNHLLVGKCQSDPLKHCLYLSAAGVIHSSIMSTLSSAFTIIHVLLTLLAVPRNSAQPCAQLVCLAWEMTMNCHSSAIQSQTDREQLRRRQTWHTESNRCLACLFYHMWSADDTRFVMHREWMSFSWRLLCGLVMLERMQWWIAYQWRQRSQRRPPCTSRRALMMLSQSGVSTTQSVWLRLAARCIGFPHSMSLDSHLLSLFVFLTRWNDDDTMMTRCLLLVVMHGK